MWMLPLHLHVNKKSDYDIMMIYEERAVCFNFIAFLPSFVCVLMSPPFLKVPWVGLWSEVMTFPEMLGQVFLG